MCWTIKKQQNRNKNNKIQLVLRARSFGGGDVVGCLGVEETEEDAARSGVDILEHKHMLNTIICLTSAMTSKVYILILNIKIDLQIFLGRFVLPALPLEWK